MDSHRIFKKKKSRQEHGWITHVLLDVTLQSDRKDTHGNMVHQLKASLPLEVTL